jgi:hypothetical protein
VRDGFKVSVLDALDRATEVARDEDEIPEAIHNMRICGRQHDGAATHEGTNGRLNGRQVAAKASRDRDPDRARSVILCRHRDFPKRAERRSALSEFCEFVRQVKGGAP